MYDFVLLLLRMTMYDFVWLCMTIYIYVWLCITRYDYAWLEMSLYNTQKCFAFISVTIYRSEVVLYSNFFPRPGPDDPYVTLYDYV